MIALDASRTLPVRATLPSFRLVAVRASVSRNSFSFRSAAVTFAGVISAGMVYCAADPSPTIVLASAISNCTPAFSGRMVLPSSLLTVAPTGSPMASAAIFSISIFGASVSSVDTSYGSKSIRRIFSVSACSTASASKCTPGLPAWMIRLSFAASHEGSTGSVIASAAISSNAFFNPSSSTAAASCASFCPSRAQATSHIRTNGLPVRPTAYAFSADCAVSTCCSTSRTGISYVVS